VATVACSSDLHPIYYLLSNLVIIFFVPICSLALLILTSSSGEKNRLDGVGIAYFGTSRVTLPWHEGVRHRASGIYEYIVRTKQVEWEGLCV